MLESKTAKATIAVSDIGRARTFYEGTLGLRPVETEEEGVAEYRTGNSELLVYESQYAGTNQATAATWTIDKDLERLVQELKAKGVKFEHYDMPGMKHQGDLHVNGAMKAAWFKDPDGNILALVSQ